MARIATPWFRSERNGWYVCKDGQQQFLGEHPDDAPPPHKHKGRWNAPPAIMQAFHALMARPADAPPIKHATGFTVAVILDKFLDWCQTHRAPRTYEGHRDRLQRFIGHLPEVVSLDALALRPFHIIEWVDKHPSWGDTYRRWAIMSVQRAYNHAEEVGYIAANPIRKIKKPAPGRRKQAVTTEQWQNIRDFYAEGDPFRDLLEFCWESGCRPHEARTIEPHHVHFDRQAVLFPPDEAKGKKRWRIIRMNQNALAILRRHLGRRTVGKVFLNAQGRPWTAYAMNCRFCRLQFAEGRKKMKELGVTLPDADIDAFILRLSKTKVVGGRKIEKTAAELRSEAKAKLLTKLARRYSPKCFAYAFRHGFATRKLIEGHDHLTVAELMGHADGTMLAKVYAHLDQHDEHLRKALG